MTDQQRLGQAGEALALSHLQQQGLRLLARNWRCRQGELDLVMLDGDTVVFVEVRYRRHAGWGGAAESVDARKRARLISAAEHFLHQEPRWQTAPCRFDVIALSPGEHSTPRLDWLQNAFQS